MLVVEFERFMLNGVGFNFKKTVGWSQNPKSKTFQMILSAEDSQIVSDPFHLLVHYSGTLYISMFKSIFFGVLEMSRHPWEPGGKNSSRSWFEISQHECVIQIEGTVTFSEKLSETYENLR